MERPSVAVLLHQALQEHDRELAELRIEVAKLRGKDLDPAVVFGGPELGSVPLRHDAEVQTDEQATTCTVVDEAVPHESGQKVRISTDAGHGAVAAKQPMRELDELELFVEGEDGTMEDAVSTEQRVQRLWNPLELVATILIVLNTIFLILQVQFEGYLTASEVGIRQGWPNSSDSVAIKLVLRVVENIFTIVFVLEFLARIVKNGRSIFYAHGRLEWINIIDLLIVSISCIDNFVLRVIHPDGTSVNLSFIRPLRFVRLMRLPVIRESSTFAQLRLLFATVVKSAASLFWSMVFLWSVMLFSSLFLAQTLIPYLYDETLDEKDKLQIYERYGTAARAYYTLFEITFSGGWPSYARPLVEQVNSLYAVFFMSYITVVIFAVFRIITALFLKDTLAAAADDEAANYKVMQKRRSTMAAKLHSFFEMADTSGDGELIAQEIKALAKSEHGERFLTLMDVHAHEVMELFKTLDSSGDGAVGSEEFVSGMLHLKEPPRSLDILCMKQDCRRMAKTLADVDAKVQLMLSAG